MGQEGSSRIAGLADQGGTGVCGLEGHSQGVGLTSHLVKPVPPDVLLDAIRRLPPREAGRPTRPDVAA